MFFKMAFLYFYSYNLKIIFPEFFCGSFIILLLLYGVFYSTSNKLKFPLLLKNSCWLSLAILIITFWLVNNSLYTFCLTLNSTFINDVFVTYIKSFLLISSISCFFLFLNYLKIESIYAFEFVILILLSVFGLLWLSYWLFILLNCKFIHTYVWKEFLLLVKIVNFI